MTRASGVGSMPGGAYGEETDNARLYDEATRVVLGELDLPHVPELPGRGAVAAMTGRTLGLIGDLGADLQPAGWRLTDAAGHEQRRARSLLAQDLDCVSERADGLQGWFKTQLAGPWTLAATVEKPRGDRVLSDHGARRELAQALAAAATEHVADLRRRMPGVELLVQVDEPALPAVLVGAVPTASGFGRHRVVHPPEASEALEAVFAAIEAAGAVPLAHCCAGDVPVDLLRGAGARGVSVDVSALAPSAYDGLATALEAGEWLLLGVVTSTPPSGAADDRAPIGLAHRFLDMLGLGPTDTTVVTPTCGLAGATTAWSRRALQQSSAVARALDGTDQTG